MKNRIKPKRLLTDSGKELTMQKKEKGSYETPHIIRSWQLNVRATPVS